MAPPAERPARRSAVLLAEHEPEVAELARRYLARAGLDVTVAATPQETIAALSERPAAAPVAPAPVDPAPVAAAVAVPIAPAPVAAVAPAALVPVPAPVLAVAVLDLTMPGLDARRLRRLLAARETPAASAPTPAIYLLGGTMRPRDVRAGAGECLRRPFSPRLLVDRVLSALPSPERHAPQAPQAPQAPYPRRPSAIPAAHVSLRSPIRPGSPVSPDNHRSPHSAPEHRQHR